MNILARGEKIQTDELKQLFSLVEGIQLTCIQDTDLPSINLDAFDILLPSFSMPFDEDEMDELDLGSEEYREMCRESFLDALTDEIIHLGQVEREIENWGTYDYNEDYFITVGGDGDCSVKIWSLPLNA
ncbi:MAG: hypothetical protein EAY81_01685 [Bacteroidetes bacterium]|nr:MAG: hypothetical protein EAY81_01685 [Bacteroidota bacterium]